MFKKIIKEIAILILLIVAIGLALVIFFYDYNPISVTIPKQVEAYALEEDIEEELEETLQVQQTQELVKTYIVDESDLYAYESSNDYDKGNPNPFAKYSTGSSNSTDNSSNSNSNTSGGNSTTDNNGDSGEFLNTIGK